MTAETDLHRQIEKLTKINKALMARVERSMDQQGNSYSLFTTAIGLETQNRARTDELKSALENLERSNEALVLARDTAERAVQVKTRFFTAVGHDVLQPLNAARLSLSALGESDEIEEHKNLARQIDHALTSIEDLLRTIIDISKLEAGMTRPAPKNIRLDEFFESIAQDFKPLVEEKGLEFHIEQHGNLGVYTDLLMSRRILQNLLANAVRYTSHGHIALRAQTSGSDVIISVEDTGPGIPAHERERIFEEFERGKSAEGLRRGGFGLGLSIVQRMATALGHDIKLQSELGRGTVFSITMPAADIRAVDSRVRSRIDYSIEQYGFENRNVLVIENDEQVQQAMEVVLNRWSCNTSAVKNLAGIANLLCDPSAKPDIVLADYHLDRDECGLDAVGLIRQKWGNEIPAIVITADHAPETTRKVAAAQCELLHKPVRPAELRALVQHMLV